MSDSSIVAAAIVLMAAIACVACAAMRIKRPDLFKDRTPPAIVEPPANDPETLVARVDRVARPSGSNWLQAERWINRPVHQRRAMTVERQLTLWGSVLIDPDTSKLRSRAAVEADPLWERELHGVGLKRAEEPSPRPDLLDTSSDKPLLSEEERPAFDGYIQRVVQGDPRVKPQHIRRQHMVLAMDASLRTDLASQINNWGAVYCSLDGDMRNVQAVINDPFGLAMTAALQETKGVTRRLDNLDDDVPESSKESFFGEKLGGLNPLSKVAADALVRSARLSPAFSMPYGGATPHPESVFEGLGQVQFRDDTANVVQADLWLQWRDSQIKLVESLRREKFNPALTPRPIANIVDYAAAAQAVELAMQALDESLPNGQKERSEQAFTLATEGLKHLRTWLTVRGYSV